MLGDYLESVREIERRVEKMEARDLSQAGPAGCPRRHSPASTQHINLMFDMVALAYQANLTRVFTLHDGGRSQQPDVQPDRRFGRLPSAFASPERHRQDGKLVKIQTYHTGIFAKFLTKLAEMPDGDGLDAGSLDLSFTAAT